MIYTYRIESVRNNEHGEKDRETLGVFAPLECETLLWYGADAQEPDGLKQWRVVQELH